MNRSKYNLWVVKSKVSTSLGTECYLWSEKFEIMFSSYEGLWACFTMKAAFSEN